MKTCRRLTVQEFVALTDPFPYANQQLCEDGCGVCCANICSSCSWNEGLTTKTICNGVEGDDPEWGIVPGSYDPQTGLAVWVPGRWKYEAQWRLGYQVHPEWQSGWQWKPGYPGALMNYVWFSEIHTYEEVQDGLVDYNEYPKRSYKTKFRVYECRDGGPVEVTDQAVQQDDFYYECNDAIGDTTGNILIGKALDRTYTYDYLKFEGPGSECSTGTITAGWSGQIQPQAFQTNNFLACSQRECKDTLSKTDCEAAGGTWQAGMACGEVNCNGI